MSKDITLGQIAFIEMGQSPDSRFVNESEVGLPFLQGNAEFGDVFPDHHLYCSHPKKICKSGDILISVRAPVGALNKANQSYCIGRGLAAIRFTEADASFGWHLLNHSAIWLQSVAQGSTFEAVSKNDLHTFPVQILPSLPEQRAIADILDTVDEAIQQTDALIAKLQRIKAGRLHDLLTRGLDEDGQLRDPIAHPEQFHETPLGLLPKAWEVVEMKTITSRITDGSHQGVKLSINGEIPFLYVSCVRDGKIIWENAGKVDLKVYQQISKGREPQTGMILYTVVGSYGHAARVNSDEPFTFQRHIACILPDETVISSKFLATWLNSPIAKEYADRIALGNAQKTVTLGDLSRFPTPLANYKEQKLIAEEIKNLEIQIDIEQTHSTKLRRVKQGLMDDLLTGRVRVSDVRLDERLEQA